MSKANQCIDRLFPTPEQKIIASLVGGALVGLTINAGFDYARPARAYERAYATNGHCLQGTNFTLENYAEEALIQPAARTNDPQILRITPHLTNAVQPAYLEFAVQHIPNRLTPQLTPHGIATIGYLASRGCTDTK